MTTKNDKGMNGEGLSTGQKQRILIARAVYKRPNFLFFDEATSALDKKTAKKMSVFSDGVVVGSAIVDIISNKQDLHFQDIFSQISKFVEGIKSSIQ